MLLGMMSESALPIMHLAVVSFRINYGRGTPHEPPFNFRYALSLIAAAALLSGCGGSQPLIGAPGAMAQSVTGGAQARRHSGSWMLPEAKRSTLLYVSDAQDNEVTVYTFPSGHVVGALDGFNGPYGECVDNAGHVFITSDNGSQIFEYPHGGTSPIATISDPGEHPAGCSINPVTGQLAVNNAYTVSNHAGSISLYTYRRRHGWGFPKMYTDAAFFYMYFCGYDNRGNLYVDGYSAYDGTFELAVLPAGRKTFTNLTLDQAINVPGGIMWDGRYMSIGDSGLSVSPIYRFEVRGTSASVVGETTLSGPNVNQFWINGDTVAGPEQGNETVGIWTYASGKAIRSITGELDWPNGLTVSPPN
jgi:hypothetical protein